MFDFIRSHQRLMQLLLLVLIVPSFALVGVSGYTNYVSGDHALVKVGRSNITQQDFDQARRNQLQEMQQNSRGNFDPSMLDNEAVRRALLESLIDRRVLVATASHERFNVSDNILRQAIASLPELQVNGQFSTERYNEVLKANGLSSKDFEQGRRAELAFSRVLGPIGASARVPVPVVDSIGKTLTEQRTIRLRAYAPADFQKDLQVTDADIKAWYDKNKQSLELPEQVSARYLLLNEAAAMQNLPAISDEEMRKYYDQNKARYVQPARVELSHILVQVAVGATESQRNEALVKAQQIAREVQADKSRFGEIARAKSEDAGTANEGGKLGWITRGSWPASLESAVFALKKGDVSDPIDGPGGYHIFQANDVQPEHGETFDQAKSKVETEIRRQLGANRFAEMATKLTGLVYDNPGSLQPAADALGLKVKSASGITRDRLLSADQAGAGAASASADATILDDVRVRRALFSSKALADKQNSGVIEISPDTMVVVRVDSVTAAHVPALEKVTDRIRKQLVDERALAAAEQSGKQDLARLQQEPSDTVPEKFSDPVAISRVNPQGLNKPLLDAVFAASVKKLPAYIGVGTAQGYMVVRIDDAHEGKTDDPALAGLSAELDQAWGRAEERAVLEALRAQAEVKMLPEAAKAIAGETESQG